MRRRAIITVISFLSLMSGCHQNKVEAVDPNAALAIVNGETLTEGDFERSQGWMPAFARQLESNSTVEITRLWSLIDMMLVSQDAQDKHLLTDAERSLAIKEALARENIQNIPYPNYEIPEEEISSWISAHPEALTEHASFTVNYALVKSEKTIPVLAAVHVLSNGAQMGYNFVGMEPLDTRTTPGPLMHNKDGHSMNAKKFNFAFVMNLHENREEPGLIGPFSSADDLIFSCPETIEILKKAPIGQPVMKSLACSGSWKAFVIPEWREDEHRMTDEKARQIAIEQLTAQKRAVFREQYIAEKLGESQPARAAQ